MEKAVIVVDVLRPSLPSLVSFVPSLVLGSKTTPPVGSKRRGAVMNQPQSFRLAGGARCFLGVGHHGAVLRAAKPRFGKILQVVFGVPDAFADDEVGVFLLV